MIQTIDTARCIQCKTCVEICTKDIIRWDEKENHSYVKYFDDCQTCYDCEISCPGGAIYVHPKHKEKVYPWHID